MIEIRIYEGSRSPGSHMVLDAMHMDRKRIFVDLLKWDVPVIEGRFEVDQFDGPGAIYLVAAGNDDAHLGSIRLLPTTGPHILGDIFPQLCDDPVPVGTDTWEISRGCLSPRLRASERLSIRNALTSAAVDFALLHGITSYTCIADMGWFSQILALGWTCMPLGLPQIIEGTLTGALRIDIHSGTPHLLREAGTYQQARLIREQQGQRSAA